jgi:hypothetical protein
MSGRERPLGPGMDPLLRLAMALRELRHAAGLTYRQLEERTHYNYSTLCLAASGTRMPSWDVTAAFVAGCQRDMKSPPDLSDWKVLWRAARYETNGGS